VHACRHGHWDDWLIRFYMLLSLVFCLSTASAQTVPRSVNTAVAGQSQVAGSGNQEKLVELFFQLKSLQSEMELLRGEIEVLNHHVVGMKQRQKDIYVDLDARIQAMELAASRTVQLSRPSTVLVSPEPTPFTPNDTSLSADSVELGGQSVAVASAGGISSVQEQALYQEAFNYLKASKYQLAIQKFGNYLQLLPQGRYASSAQYWLGEARYVLRDFDGAIKDFTKVTKNYSDAAKVPDAYLKIGFSYQELEDIDTAKLYLERVVDNYASSTAARLASRRLQQMKLQQ